MGGSGGDVMGGSGGNLSGGSGGNPIGGQPTGGISGSPTSGGGGNPTGGIGGSPTGGGGNPSGGSGGDPSGGSGGNPSGGSGGDPSGGNGGAETGGAGACDPGTTHSGGTQYCEYTSVDLGNGYHHLLWSNGGGSLCTTVFDDEATFACEWNTSGNFLALTGLMYDATQTPDQIGTFSANFAVTGSGNGLVFIGVHGRMDDPAVESITVDGGTYTVHEDQILGETIIPQYYSIRTERRQCGHISVSEHFSQWADMELPLGKLERVTFVVEGINSDIGSYEFTKATMTAQ
jgi:hypothetical protein